MRIRTLVAGLTAGLLVAIGLAGPARAATVNASYTSWTWNVAGWTMHRGATNDGLIPALADSIRNRAAHFAALNELCWDQYKAVQANLLASGWPADDTNFSRFEAHNDTACGGEPFGVAIFSKAPLGPANRYALAEDGTSERRKLLCAPLAARPHLRFCTTHITPSNSVINGQSINVTQLTEVRSRLDSFAAAGDTVLIAGDFNAQPHYGRLDAWYSPSLNTAYNGGNTGHHRELDDTDTRCLGYGETTVYDGNTEGLCGQGKKIDLIFVRDDRITGPYSGDSLSISTACGGPCSDHRILIGTVTVSVTV
ncbi:endonuclease/exonuclease/phosphatase family protein [Micromonospora mirobrigensis]|uniref:Endonuclease/Exonuclease/phosphatase family protein n=1 Tax=Micromonospora mirobrigensis TaxID=262898 RepID=A0A1C4XZE4_9ACTN|nr:endonuclease/exonuclease/phosphatase family protein [Micromonospora mirobrigensis]SCF13847.1 Endonuclease/Exonuclease/phosphatase family protein [Micromonospora mirobrigensis]